MQNPCSDRGLCVTPGSPWRLAEHACCGILSFLLYEEHPGKEGLSYAVGSKSESCMAGNANGSVVRGVRARRTES